MATDNGFTVTLDDRAVQKALKEAERRSVDARQAWKAIASAMETAADDTFRKEGARDGLPKWKQLSEARLKQRREGRDTNKTAKILDDTSQLRNSIVSEYGKDYAATGVKLGDDAEDYAPAHQNGVPSKNLPARPFLVVTDADINEAAETILDFVAGAFA